MERIIAAEMLSFLRKHNVISQQQHGFLSRRSTVTNLIETLNDWTIALKHRHLTTSVFVDYSKAFDVVSHSKLLYKLSNMGISGDLLAWISYFLTDRSQVTRVGHSVSEQLGLHSGVIQGSCLGPILFVLYINDVTSLFGNNVQCKLYADDVKLYSVIKSIDDQTDLQTALDGLKQWSDAWQLNISVGKCATLNIGHVSHCHSTNINADQTYSIGSEVLPAETVVKDLGVLTDNLLKYSDHINNIRSRALRLVGLLFKCFETRDTSVLVKAFVTYIRPIVEYASCVWSPTQIGLIEAVESVQRRFTKRLKGMDALTYSQRLKQLKLDSLELRRLRFDLILTYKIIFGLCDIDVSKLFTLRTDSRTRGHSYKILVENGEINSRKNFFVNRVTPVWNNLPIDIIKFESLAQFKRSLLNVSLNTFTYF